MYSMGNEKCENWENSPNLYDDCDDHNDDHDVQNGEGKL